MAAEMTSRERVHAALDHRVPDRVPTAIGGGPYGLVDELYLALLDRFGLGGPVAPFRRGHNITYLDDRVFERLGVDTRYVWPGASPSSPARPTDDPETFLDGYGQPWKRALPYYYPGRPLLADAEDVDDIDRRVRWPDASDPAWTAGVRARARSLREDTDAFVVGRMVTSHGPFQMACSLRGTEAFMIDMATDAAFAHRLLERVGDTIDGLMRAYLEAGGRYFDMIELPGDDYASNTGLLISPQMHRTFVQPVLRRFVETVKTFRSDLKVMLHSDGQITPLLDDFIALGIDVVHPLEPLEAMDQAAVKAAYGDRLAFLGGVDIATAMPGSRDDVVEEVRRCVRTLAPGGGYVLAPANHLQADVPPENVVTLFEAARRCGTYPLHTMQPTT